MKYLKQLMFIICLLFGIYPVLAWSGTGEAFVMTTGGEQGTYIKFGQHIRDIVADRSKGDIEIIVKPSSGSMQNIELVLDKDSLASLAIVQSDVPSIIDNRALVKEEDAENVKKGMGKLVVLLPFYQEEVHLFSNSLIKDIHELQGKRVNIGNSGSGTYITAKNILHRLGVEVNEQNMGSLEGLVNVVSGKLDASFYVVGKPAENFSNLSKILAKNNIDSAKYHLLNIPSEGLPNYYFKANITSEDYDWVTADVNTIAVKALFIAADFFDKSSEIKTKKCRQIKELYKILETNIEQLKPLHPKWQEVEFSHVDIEGWRMDKCNSAETNISTPTKALADFFK